MNGSRWLIVLSPDGAARTVSGLIADSFADRFQESCKRFDTLVYRQVFSRMLREPHDDMVADLLNQSLVVTALDFRATHMLVCSLAPVTLFALRLLRGQGVKTAHWLYEDFRRASYWRDVLGGYDHFFAFQEGSLPASCADADTRYHFLPAAATEVIPLPATDLTERVFDVAFVGIPSDYRIALLERIAQAGMSLAVAGCGWERYDGPLRPFIVNDRWTPEDEAMRLLGRSRIGFNCSITPPDELTHVSPRVYDVIAAGCALVTERVPLLSASLPSCGYYGFDGAEDLVGVLRLALEEFDGRSREREIDRERVLDEHSYRRRMETILEAAM